MKVLLNDLINLMRLDGHVVERRPVDLNGVMAEVRADLDLAISRSGGRVECGDLPAVVGDESLLRILLQNLVANAIKFARSGVPPVIRVECSSTAESHEIRVKDNGIGIPADHLEGVFEMFTRLNSRKRFEGTGLGLSICRRIVEMHNGRITATSEPGLGSCFRLQLSALRAAVTKETENANR
jgi:signal transduction histidine kinase